MYVTGKIDPMADLELTVLFEVVEDGWIMASLPELPGVLTQGRTLEEARHNILDALSMVLGGDPEASDTEASGTHIERLALALTN